MTTETNFQNIRYTINESTMLSQSTWDYGTVKKFSVAIMRKVGRSWELENVTEGGVSAKSSSARHIGDAEMRRSYAMIDLSRPLLEAEFGANNVPVRFYRDNVFKTKRRKD